MGAVGHAGLWEIAEKNLREQDERAAAAKQAAQAASEQLLTKIAAREALREREQRRQRREEYRAQRQRKQSRHHLMRSARRPVSDLGSDPIIGPGKHMGARSELIACVWLLNRGYEVFRNVSAHGPIDVIAVRGDVVLRFDVKTEAKQNQFRAQARTGVKLLIVEMWNNWNCRIEPAE